jgi:hypothetical protein
VAHDDEEVRIMHCRLAKILVFLVIGCAPAATAGDLVVDGRVVTTGGWYEFADGSSQNSAAYPRWSQVAIVDAQGRGDYTDPAAAMLDRATWCPSPDASNPCLLKILPGWYDIGPATVTMQPFIDIEGSGRDVTTIRSASSAATVYGADAAEIRSLTVRNDGDGGFPVGISFDEYLHRLRITNVDVVVSGANTLNVGVSLSQSAPVIDATRVVVYGGDDALGIKLWGCDAVLRNVDVQVSTVPAGDTVTGIEISGGATTSLLRESRVSVGNADETYGIRIISSTPLIDNVTVAVSSLGEGWGFLNQGGIVTITNSSTEVIGGVSATGMYSFDSGSSTLRDVEIDVGYASGTNTGVASAAAAQVRLEQVSITARDGIFAYAVNNWGGGDTALIDVTAEAGGASDYNYGVLNQDSALVYANNLVVEASGGTGSYGVLNADNGGTVKLDRSTVIGTSSSVRNDNTSADFFVGASKLEGPLSTNLTCFGNYDATYSAVGCP